VWRNSLNINVAMKLPAAKAWILVLASALMVILIAFGMVISTLTAPVTLLIILLSLNILLIVSQAALIRSRIIIAPLELDLLLVVSKVLEAVNALMDWFVLGVLDMKSVVLAEQALSKIDKYT